MESKVYLLSFAISQSEASHEKSEPRPLLFSLADSPPNICSIIIMIYYFRIRFDHVAIHEELSAVFRQLFEQKNSSPACPSSMPCTSPLLLAFI